jgi:hypothetical protein
MRWAGHVARMGGERRDHSEHRGVDGRMGSEWILGDWLGAGVDSTG